MLDTEQQQVETTSSDVAGESNEAPSPEASADTPATRDDLVAAARDALNGKAEPAAETQEAPAEEEPRWMRLTREREKGMAAREAEEKAAADIKARAEAEAARIIEEARTRAKAVADEEQQAWLKAYQADPEAALRRLGGAEDVANKLIELNSPQGKTLAAIRAELAETKAKAATADEVKKEFETWKEQQKLEAAKTQYQQVVQTFMGNHASPEKAPHLHAVYDHDEIVAKADAVARDWQKAGVAFELGDIAEYLEAKAKERLSARGFAPAQQVRAAPGNPAGNAPKVSANGSRTITAAAGSERRAAPRPFHELSPKEQQEDLLRVAREAMRQHGKA
jgi:colicin import membrane protein